MDMDIIGAALFVGSIVWDLGRRFANRGQSIDPNDFQDVAHTVETHGEHLGELHKVQEQLKALQDLRTIVDTHNEALKTHADRILEHGSQITTHARTLTALGLAKSVGGKHG